MITDTTELCVTFSMFIIEVSQKAEILALLLSYDLIQFPMKFFRRFRAFCNHVCALVSHKIAKLSSCALIARIFAAFPCNSTFLAELDCRK